jgi:hypothetical protein
MGNIMGKLKQNSWVVYDKFIGISVKLLKYNFKRTQKFIGHIHEYLAIEKRVVNGRRQDVWPKDSKS